ncbi:MAG: hypothetical protein NTY48_01750 [Candidatus Diapherotrites archaeon]|nr:hypothetical protein [Candidatus Diapherotrites archaeon]
MGKLGVRLAEQEAMRAGGKRMYIHTDQKHVLVLALSLGYKFPIEAESEIREILKLGPKQKLPKRQELILLLKSREINENTPRLRLLRELEIKKNLK